MTQSSGLVRSVILYLGALFFGLLSAFFVFYTARLFYITSGLRSIRPGGQGAYIGAVVFPLLAILLAWFAWRCTKAARRV